MIIPLTINRSGYPLTRQSLVYSLVAKKRNWQVGGDVEDANVAFLS